MTAVVRGPALRARRAESLEAGLAASEVRR